MMKWTLAAVGALTAFGCATAAQACAVSHPLSDAVLAERAVEEGRAWRDATVVYVARITAASAGYRTFTMETVRTLRGEGAPATIELRSLPSPGICLIYHGLNVEDGAYIGDEFVIYALDARPTPDSRMLIVSTRMLQDPQTLIALESGS